MHKGWEIRCSCEIEWGQEKKKKLREIKTIFKKRLTIILWLEWTYVMILEARKVTLMSIILQNLREKKKSSHNCGNICTQPSDGWYHRITKVGGGRS